MKHSTITKAAATIGLVGILALTGCSGGDDDSKAAPTPGPSATASPSDGGSSDSPSDGEDDSKSDSSVDPKLQTTVDKIIADGIKNNPDAVNNVTDIITEANKYLKVHEGSAASGSDNPFTVLKHFSPETNEKLFEIYSKNSPMLKYFNLDGLEPHEKAAIALWSQGLPMVFNAGEAVLPSDAFISDGKKATVDLSQGQVSGAAGNGPLTTMTDDLQEIPMVKADGEWKIDSKLYYKKLEKLES